jgi:predicted ATP-dependent endonuclease of OLD family
MIIDTIQVQNFCCIQNEKLSCEYLTALIGPNGSGKSSFLRALEMFYNPNTNYTEDDFFNKDISKDIIITVTYTDLTDKEKELFKSYIEGSKLTVEKIMKWPSNRGNQKYYGSRLQNSDFDTYRLATGANLKKEYNILKENKYTEFPNYTNKDDAERTLQSWEESHPELCIHHRDDGQFFGFKEIGKARLEKYTRFIPIPAVHDASDDIIERRGSPLAEIMDLVVRSVLAERKEIIELQEKTQKQYEKLVDPTKLNELQELEKELTDTLKTYIPNTGIKLDWIKGEAIVIPMPKAEVKLIEDQYAASVVRTGHGLQRAFILTMLQHLAIIQSPLKEDEETTGELPNLIIGIEEPELYQHPNRQRHLSKIFLKLASGSIKGTVNRTQIIYSTHSPLFIDLKRFDKIRILRKIDTGVGLPKQTKIIHTNLDEIAKIIEKADAKPEGTYSGKTLEPRLETLMTPWMNEGFFADVAVLVEGEEDRAAILGTAKTMGYDFESMGISIIPCMGKNNLDRPTAIFNKLEIPVYVIWDGDYGNVNAKPEDNHRLLRLCGQPIEDWPEHVTKHFTCFKTTLNTTMSNEFGEDLLNKSLEKICNQLCLGKKKHAIKNPLVITKIIEEVNKNGKNCKPLESVIKNIINLKK